MAELKPAYLIHGEDHGALAERRASLRALAEADAGGTGVELLEGDAATPAGVARALASMTLALGRRVVIVDGVERWREKEVQELIAPALEQLPADTTVAFFAREESRAKAPAALHEAVRHAGGQVRAQATVKPWELPKWVQAEAKRLGLALDPGAAKALIALTGERQQRLVRELEKLSLARAGEAGEVGVEEIEQLAAQSAESRAYAFADALVAGERREASVRYVRLRAQGEQLPGLIYLMAKRAREALAVVQMLADGEPAAKIKERLRPLPPRAAERLIAQLRGSDPQRLRAALGVLAELELSSRGGSPLPQAREPACGLQEDTQALRAIEAITAA